MRLMILTGEPVRGGAETTTGCAVALDPPHEVLGPPMAVGVE